MALFGKKKETKKSEKEVVKVDVSNAHATDFDLTAVITGPKLSEKTVNLGDSNNVYTFTVQRSATKYQVRDAVKSLYNVTPVKINIVNKKPAKRMVGSRNRTKHVQGQKKAYVYLKKGETINLV